MIDSRHLVCLPRQAKVARCMLLASLVLFLGLVFRFVGSEGYSDGVALAIWAVPLSLAAFGDEMLHSVWITKHAGLDGLLINRQQQLLIAQDVARMTQSMLRSAPICRL